MNIEAEAAHAVGWIAHPFNRHHDQEHTVTQPQPRVVDSLHAITAELASNPLIARLAEHRLGMLLTPQEADHITALIASVEQPRRQQVADGTQMQPVQQ